MIAWQAYADEIEALIGVRFRHQGRHASGGVDCVGLPWLAAVNAGLQLEPTPIYNLQPTQQEMEEGLALFCDRVDDPALAHIWQVPFPGGMRHVFVPLQDVAGGTRCVQANSRRGVVLATTWNRAHSCGWAFRGIKWRQ